MPGLDKLVAIAEAGNVNIAWLATGEGPMRPGDKVEEKEIIKKEQPAISADYDNFRISEKMQKTVEILESDTIYRPSLAANIDAFHHGMTQEKVVQEQQAQIAANQQQIANLEARMAVLEKSIACATVTPDNYKITPKSNGNSAE